MDALVFVMMLWAPTTFAALGSHDASVIRPNVIQINPAFSVHETVSHGSTVREYIDARGTVFAVTWQGIKEPGLIDLLGSYYSEYKTEFSNRKKQPGHQPLTVTTSQITVHKWGHMRAMRGRAYLLGRLPEGVRAEDLQ